VQHVVCPGSFDPVANGHLDIVSRAAGLYDEVVVAVLINITKQTLFTVDERVEMLCDVTRGYGNVHVGRFHGLLVDFCAVNGITAVVKGLHGQRLRVRDADGADELPAGQGRDAVHDGEPAVLVPQF
jgi:pantetheine-phosphate adenylyltransferase